MASCLEWEADGGCILFKVMGAVGVLTTTARCPGARGAGVDALRLLPTLERFWPWLYEARRGRRVSLVADAMSAVAPTHGHGRVSRRDASPLPSASTRGARRRGGGLAVVKRSAREVLLLATSSPRRTSLSETMRFRLPPPPARNVDERFRERRCVRPPPHPRSVAARRAGRALESAAAPLPNHPLPRRGEAVAPSRGRTTTRPDRAGRADTGGDLM